MNFPFGPGPETKQLLPIRLGDYDAAPIPVALGVPATVAVALWGIVLGHRRAVA